jgi:hypothetical protein
VVLALASALVVGGSHLSLTAQASASKESSASASQSPASFSVQDTATPTDLASPSAQTPQPTITPPTSKPAPRATPLPAACTPTDQDQYVYHPYRLQVEAACIHVTGVIQAVRREADGDFHILLALDPQYAYLLTPANQGVELGDLVVEPICVKSVTQTDAIAVCAADPDPLPSPYPTVGERVWMEGRYVFDLDHSGWAELHPLYRWGPL